MFTTKLILIEGLPGAGKTTTTTHLGATLARQHGACQWFLEEDEPHPIACLDLPLSELTERIVPLWRAFVAHALDMPGVTLIESRLWQNTALFMLMQGYALDAILHYHHTVCAVLAPLAPVLVYLDHADVAAAVRRLPVLRGEAWVQDTLAQVESYRWFQARGGADFAGFVQFCAEWHTVAERLYADWPYAQVRLVDAHHDWARAEAHLVDFLSG